MKMRMMARPLPISRNRSGSLRPTWRSWSTRHVSSLCAMGSGLSSLARQTPENLALSMRWRKARRPLSPTFAGTTRDVIEVPLAIDGIPFVLVDTAGLRDSDDVVEAIGVGRAKEQAEQADLLLWLGAEQSAATPGPDPDRGEVRPEFGRRRAGRVDGVGTGLGELMRSLVERASSLLPKADELALDRRQHDLLADAHQALERGAQLDDPVLVAEELRNARLAIDRISGRAGVEDLLDALFGRFCLGK